VLPITVRDFSREHPDFGGIPKAGNPADLFIGDEVRRKLVSPELGDGRKPVFLSAKGCAAPPDQLAQPVESCANWGDNIPDTLTTPENFLQWYRDTPGQNYSFEKELPLADDDGDGVFVFDSAAFFPLTTSEGYGEVTGDASDNITPGYNYLFTTEIHLQFQYVPGQKFTFRGDDDLWVFVNGKLAIDLGGLHMPIEQTLDFDAQAQALGITAGKTYQMDIFHAERHRELSNFRVETNISCFETVDIVLK